MKIQEPSVPEDKNSKLVNVGQTAKNNDEPPEDFFDLENDEDDGDIITANPFLLITGKNGGEDTEKMKKEIMDKFEAFEKTCNARMTMLDKKLFAADRTFMSRLEGI